LAAVLTTPPAELLAHAPSTRPASAAKSEARVGGTMASADALYPAIAAHPLFYPTRTPWIPPATPVELQAASAPSPLTGYTLVGVIVSGSARSALIKASGTNKTVMLGEGKQLEGWTLREITRERLYFAAGDDTYGMTLLKPSEAQR